MNHIIYQAKEKLYQAILHYSDDDLVFESKRILTDVIWENRLGPKERALIKQVFQDAIERLGYTW